MASAAAALRTPAIVAAVESPSPPGFLLLGSDALALHRYVADARTAEVAAWESTTTSTDYAAT